jgi:hypothetical protein
MATTLNKHKLANIVFTIPAITASAERSFSALKRIKLYLCCTQVQERLSHLSLSLLSIEKVLVGDLKKKPNCYDQVIEKFTAVDRRAGLHFKHSINIR